MLLTAMSPIMSVRLNQMGYYGQGTQFLICLTLIGCLKESRCYKTSSFRNGSSLKLGELAKLIPKLSFNRSPLFHQGRQRGLRFRRILRLSQERSTSLKRPRPKDQATPKVSKHARSASTSRRSLSPRRVYPRGTSTATRPHQTTPKRAENRTVQTQDLEIFKRLC